MALRYDQWRNFRLFGAFRWYFPSFCPYFLHLRSFEVGELPEVLILGKIEGFVFFFEMNLHKILPDGRVGLGAYWTVNGHIGAGRGCR